MHFWLVTGIMKVTHMKRLLTDYPKFLLFGSAIAISYLLYRQGSFHWITQHLDGFGYPSIFFAGFLYSFGFTSPFAVAYFVEMAPHVSPVPAAILGAIGAATADVGIFEFVSISMHQEIERLSATSVFRHLYALFHHDTISEKLRRIARWALAAVIIGSPFPDEIGMSLLAGLTHLEGKRVTIFCFGMNTVGIFVILTLAR